MSSRVVEFVPTDYTEFYQHYRPFLLNIMRSAGILDAEVEDVAHAILVKFIQHDALSDYDPNYTTVYQGQVRKARFSTFLSGFVYKYLLHHKTVQEKRARREPISIDISEEDSERPLGDILSEPSFLDIEDFEVSHTLAAIRESIVRMGPQTKRGKLDLVLFFDLVLLQVGERGRVDTQELANLFEVSTTTIREWIQRLRPLFKEAFAS